MADAATQRVDPVGRTCPLVKNVSFLDLLARPNAAGGYFPRVNVDGRDLSSTDLYADDNALIGLALLDAREVSPDQAWQRGLLRRAEGAAQLLTGGGFWDDTF